MILSFTKKKCLLSENDGGIASAKLVHVSYHLLLQQFKNRRIKFRNLWLNLQYVFLTMTKMRGKIPLEKKEMYGNQEGYILTKFNQ
jgi:hypothetical protein